MSGIGPDIEQLRSMAETRGFESSLDDAVGELLTVLAASKPSGRLLELGTGAGVGTAYLLRGADPDSTLTTVDLDASLSRLAQEQIVDDRVRWVVGDGGAWLAEQEPGASYDLIFADTWPGKFTHLDRALGLLAPGGLYVVDDLRPQPGWPDQHQPRVDGLLRDLRANPDLVVTTIDWGSGLLIAARVGSR